MKAAFIRSQIKLAVLGVICNGFGPIAIAINIAIGLLSLASPFMMQLLTDDVLVRGDTQLLTTVAIGVIAMNFIRSAISLVQSHLISHFGQRLQLGLILKYGRKLLHLPLSYFEGRRSGEVVSSMLMSRPSIT
ncbi:MULTISPECIES: ABC transporter transmembrane domain-containing protein [unclassified Nostoc]|uniref:ABC transporter transmembrane domain-containing protein n=1 Tax=Nostoc sp. S13 TaxID=3019266 RepID=UPI00261AA24E|nr:ABC transporter transmembrane domain-containing protein [Nostoc sp. S13]MDF5734556.1 ABC transporter transmembrane domain-containing protein [Nostoc sp. S13]